MGKRYPPFNPANKDDRQLFSDEWVKYNSWMGDENERDKRTRQQKRVRKMYDDLLSECRTKIRVPTFEQWCEYLSSEPFDPSACPMEAFIRNQPNFDPMHPPIFINHKNSIPIPKIQKEQMEYLSWKSKQKEKMAIFNEMLGEKSIRAGRAGVGEAHKGWGRSKRKG
jgi:hypothetical protein